MKRRFTSNLAGRFIPKPEDLPSDLEEFFRELAGGRVQTLDELRSATLLRAALLEHEALRLEQKLGPDDKRAQLLRAGAEHSRALVGSLSTELDLASVQPVQAEPGAAVLEGRLTDPAGAGLDGLTVRLEDESGQPIGQATPAETDRAGYYAISVSKEALAQQPELARRGAFLAVRNAKGELVERTPQPLQLEGGARLNLSAALTRSEAFTPRAAGAATGAAPPPAADEPPTKSPRPKKEKGKDDPKAAA